MEEAEMLGDRVAFIDHGLIHSIGTPLFLKDRFGFDYSLVIHKDQEFANEYKSIKLELVKRGIVHDIVSENGKENRITIHR